MFLYSLSSLRPVIGTFNPEQPYGCEDLNFMCNEAGRLFFAPSRHRDSLTTMLSGSRFP